MKSDEEKIIELEKEIERLKKRDEGFLNMLGFVSHELKSPLSTAMMNVFALKGGYLGEINPKHKKVLESAAKSLKDFENIIKRYLDLGRIEEGNLNIATENINLLTDIILPVIESYNHTINTCNIELINNIKETIIKGDKKLLFGVFNNLLSNAIIYGKENSKIELNSEIKNDFIEISVYNEGIGINKENIPLLFSKFERLSAGSEIRKKGAGIGLFTAKEIIKAHGGQIRIESEEGQWTKVYFTLPICEDIK